MLRKKIAILLIALAALIGCDTSNFPAPPTLAIGQPFPEISFVSLDGDKVALSSFRGKLVVLNVWATWCGPCRRELPSLDSLDKLLDDNKFVVLGLSIDEDDLLVREYLADKGIKLPVYLNAEDVLNYAALGVNVFPYTFVIAPDGRLVQKHAGEKVWNSAEVVHNLQGLLE